MLPFALAHACVLHVLHNAALPPLIPPWAPTYDLQRSLIAMPCNETGWSDSAFFSKFGIVSYDMNNAQDIWEANGNPEETLIEQCARTKRESPAVKCGVYRNSAHMWSNYATVRKALQDPQYWGFFLPWANTTARNYSSTHPGENLYYDVMQTPHPAIAPWSGKCQCVGALAAEPCSDPVPACNCGEGVPCGEFAFDQTNSSLMDWILDEYIGGPNGFGSPHVDFMFLDDTWSLELGPGEMATDSVAKMGLSKADVEAQYNAYWRNARLMLEGIVKRGGFAWQAMINVGNGPTSTLAEAPFTPAQCTEYMRTTACRPDSVLQRAALFYGLTRGSYPPYAGAVDVNNSVAAFMLIRGPHAYIGWSWLSCSGDCFAGKQQCPSTSPGYTIPYDATLNGLVGPDYGEPLEVCHEERPGSETFVRQWSKATVTVDCKAWTSSIDLKS